MDGTLAGIFLIASLTDMGLNHCRQSGCVTPDDAPHRFGLQAAAVAFDEDIIGEEIGLTYDLPRRYGPFQPTMAVSLTEEGRIWAGAGLRWQKQIAGRAFVDASLMPGVDMGHNDPALGGNLQFRSSLGIGWDFGSGQLVAAYDHRSNADTRSINPGLETISIRYTFVLD